MILHRAVPLVLCFGALAAPAMAQSGGSLDDLDADRLNARQVLIEFEYDGGACEEVGEPQLGETVDGTLAVTFTANSTAEICTMQVVEIEVKEAVAAGPDVTRVEVTLIGTNGDVFATQVTDVDED